MEVDTEKDGENSREDDETEGNLGFVYSENILYHPDRHQQIIVRRQLSRKSIFAWKRSHRMASDGSTSNCYDLFGRWALLEDLKSQTRPYIKDT